MILDLPYDVHLVIFGFLNALDIISLGKTCHIFQEAALRRTLWTNTLQRMSFSNAIYPPTFQPDGMSVAALQRAATGPERTLSLIRNRQSSEDDPLVLSPDHTLKPNPNIETTFYFVFLVPGGRYMVANGKVDLRIWDLHASNPEVPIITQVTPEMSLINRRFTIGPGPKYTMFRIVLSGRLWEMDEGSMAKIVVYEFSEDSLSSGLTSYTSPLPARNDRHIDMCSLHQDIFVYICGRYLHVWNFVADTYACWTTQEDGFEEMLVNSHHIILIGRHNISGWSIPDLHPRIGTPAGPLVEITPSFKILMDSPLNNGPNFSDPYLNDEFICEHLPDWYSPSHCLATFDVLSRRTEDSHYKFTTMSLSLPSSGSQGELRRIFTFPLPETPYYETITLDSRICNDQIVHGWRNGIYFYLAATPLVPRPNGPIPGTVDKANRQCFQILKVSSGPSDYRRSEYSFDPISGKLCVLVRDEILIFNIFK